MKVLVTLATLLFAFSVHAADRKVGNVIAIERDVTNIYDSCMSTVTPDPTTTKSSDTYSCFVKSPMNPNDTPLTRAHFLKNVGSDCDVEGDIENGSLLITFNTSADTSSYADSQACLKRALDVINDSTKIILYTVE